MPLLPSKERASKAICGALLCAALAMPCFAQTQNSTKPGSTKYKLHRVGAAVVSGAATAGQALLGGDASFPPSFAQDPNWPFSAPRTSARDARSQFHVIWTDGTQSNIEGNPSQGYRITSGDDAGTTIMPIGSGRYAITTGDGGQQAVMSPTPGGSYTITAADGTTINLFPRAEGGWDMDQNGVALGSIIPGPDGSQYGFGASSSFFSFRL